MNHLWKNTEYWRGKASPVGAEEDEVVVEVEEGVAEDEVVVDVEDHEVVLK